jgi:hypothetical protein
MFSRFTNKSRCLIDALENTLRELKYVTLTHVKVDASRPSKPSRYAGVAMRRPSVLPGYSSYRVLEVGFSYLAGIVFACFKLCFVYIIIVEASIFEGGVDGYPRIS